MKKTIKIVLAVLFLSPLSLFLAGALYSPDLEIQGGLDGRHVEIDAQRIRVHQQGKGRDVLFLHGGMGSLEDWEPVFRRTGPGYRLTAFDRPGMGYSELEGEAYSLNGAADVTLSLIRTLKLERVILVGHSYGGGVALATAVRNDPGVAGVLLIAPAAYSLGIYERRDSPVMKLLRLPYFGRGLALAAGPLLGDRMIAAVLEPMTSGRPAFGPGFISFRQGLWNKAVSTTTRALQGRAFLRDMPSISSRYPDIRVPVRLLIGDDDMEELISFVPLLERDIPGLRTRRLPGVDHYLQFEDPAAVVEEIQALAGKRPRADL